MYCDLCGSPVQDGTEICPYCGQYLTPARNGRRLSAERTQRYASGHYTGRYTAPARGNEGGRGVTIGILVLLLVVGVIVMAVANVPADSTPRNDPRPPSEPAQTAADPVIGRWNNTGVEYRSKAYPADEEVYVTFYDGGSVVLMVDGDAYAGSWQGGGDAQDGLAAYQLDFPGRDYYPYCYLYGSPDEILVIGVSGGYVMYFSR